MIELMLLAPFFCILWSAFFYRNRDHKGVNSTLTPAHIVAMVWVNSAMVMLFVYFLVEGL